MANIKDFWINVEMRNGVKAYLDNALEQLAISKAFKREDTTHIADAKDAIDEAWYNMGIDLDQKSENKPIVNEAR